MIDPTTTILAKIADAVQADPAFSDISFDGDNQDAELFLTFEGREYILRSRHIEPAPSDATA